MPELAEVEFYRKQWNPGRGQIVRAVEAHPQARIFRAASATQVATALRGEAMNASLAAGKQMLFRFGADAWLGVHLGMSGELAARGLDFVAGRHDHLVLRTANAALVFTDPRMFGRIDVTIGTAAPAWWTRVAPAILSDAFAVQSVADYLQRRRRAPLKTVLLIQERFPGIGNWMADEILWRAGIHPRRRAGSLGPSDVRALWRECRQVCRMALHAIAGRRENEMPSALNSRIPDSWLFNHRWENGGRCPKTGRPLVREVVGGRTTCWSPARQKLHRR